MQQYREATIQVTADTVPELHELRPERWAELRELEKYEATDIVPETTDLFTCPRCKKRECIYQMVQMRSGDEGMTAAVECIPCGYRFRG
jgi:DNA-directed RNA polymerase subunit M/transcription elongation factor TFIIS